VPLGVLLTGVYDILCAWAARQQNFRQVSAAQVTQALTGNGVKILVAVVFVAGIGGQVVGQLTGLLGAAVTLAVLSCRSRRQVPFSREEPHSLRAVAKRYRKCPQFLCWATLLNQVATQMPPILLARFFSPAATGLYYLGDRLLGFPISTVGGAVSRVFFQRAAADWHSAGGTGRVVLRTFQGLLLLGSGPLLVLGLLGPQLFSWIFGAEWREAGVYAQLLAPLYLLKFAVSPLTTSLTVAEKQELALQLQFLYAILTAGAFLIGARFDSVRTALLLFSLGASIRYGLELALCLRYSKRLAEPAPNDP